METRKGHSSFRRSFFFFLLLLLNKTAAGKRRVSVSGDLSDIVDEEEDEEWRKWGQKKTRSEQLLPPPDFSNLNPAEIEAEMMKRHTGPVYGFVKLRPDAARFTDDVPVIAMRWSNLIKTGSIEARFMAVDRHTIMFTMERGQVLKEFKEFVLSQPEAYEMKIGDQLFRRAGDPPLDQVIQKLHTEKVTDHSNDEL